MTSNNRDKFIYLAGQYNQLVNFYNVEKLCPDKISEVKQLFPTAEKTRFTIAMFYRFFIPRVLPSSIERAIYLDSDTIVNLDISELWKTNLDNKPLGAIAELYIEKDPLTAASKKYLIRNNLVAYEDYFNSGVLLMDLDYFRQNEDLLLNGLKFLSLHPEMGSPDQDVLNYLFSKNYVKLSEKFDVFIDKARINPQIRPAIYHYFDDTLQLNMDDPFNRLWMDYFIKTPWFDSNALGNIYKTIKKFNRAREDSLIPFSVSLSEATAGKARVIVVNKKSNKDWIKKTYALKEDEGIFTYEDENSIQELIDEMNDSRDKKIFFIRQTGLIESLKKAGFVEGKDFIYHWTFFCPHLITNKDIFTIIKEM
ncbi:MAG: hypothetical protein IKT98_05825 [Selenomonadaceae bacterium]|nr:hypothetical protein [Selenomonadaceae bacterium]